jgi:hypothetical protein
MFFDSVAVTVLVPGNEDGRPSSRTDSIGNSVITFIDPKDMGNVFV